jgi:DNA-binding transcriptional MerR regulator
MDLTIGELARRSGYAVQTLRYYEQIGLMPKPPRTSGGQRRYSDDLVKRLLFIRHARDLGFEVKDIRSLLDLAGHPEQPCASVDAIAQRHLAAIDAKIASLKALRGEISGVLECCAKSRISECGVIDLIGASDGSAKIIGRCRT